jgi:ferredoxin
MLAQYRSDLPARATLLYARAVDHAASPSPLVRFQPSGRALRVERGTTLLEAARRAGLPIASACGADGICARCAVRVLAGALALSPETELEERQKVRNRIDPTLRLACRAAALGDVEVTAGYW